MYVSNSIWIVCVMLTNEENIKTRYIDEKSNQQILKLDDE